MRPTKVSCNPQALRHNLQVIRQIAPQSAVMAMLKADAYGHGLVSTARVLAEQVDYFGVACIEEARALRVAGLANPLVCLEGFFQADELTWLAQNHCELVIHAPWQLKALQSAQLPKPITVWLKIDTGMHRLGFPMRDIAEVSAILNHLPQVTQLNAMTHFAAADERDSPVTPEQIAGFKRAWGDRPGKQSLANSAGILAWPAAHADVVRPGIMLYGVSPFAKTVGQDFNLQPVMQLSSAIMAIQIVSAGEAVGYNGTYRCPETMPVGLVSIGYGDGYPRHIKANTPVKIQEKLVPIIGRVSMDMLAVDLRQLPTVAIGEPVLLWGEGLPVETIAEAAGTNAYELLCQVTTRVARVL